MQQQSSRPLESTDARTGAVARTAELVASLEVVLGQAEDLCSRIDDVCFSKRCAAFGDSTIGQYLRHCFDHFDQFLAGIESGIVDYDARGRDGVCEQAVEPACARVATIRTALHDRVAPLAADRALRVRQACHADGDLESEVSTCGRELQFLLSHTVHHFAMVAAICRMEGIEVPAEYGVAPSTLRYRREDRVGG